MGDLTPRGPAWNRRSLRMPDDAVPWAQRGNVASVATATEVPIFTYSVLPEVNLRVAGMVYAATAANINFSWRWYRNGNRYDSTYGNLRIGAAVSPLFIPLYMVFGAGDLAEVRIENLSGVTRDFTVYAWGWLFA